MSSKCLLYLFNNDGEDSDNDGGSGDDDSRDDTDSAAENHDTGHILDDTDAAGTPYRFVLDLNLIGAWVSPFH
jgi:hypothetical protein